MLVTSVSSTPAVIGRVTEVFRLLDGIATPQSALPDCN